MHNVSDESQDLTLAGLSVECSAHVDDSRTSCAGMDNVNGQVNTTFVTSNYLALHAEIVHFSCHALPVEPIDLVNQSVVTKKEAKCLGVWWCQDLSSKQSFEKNINKVHCLHLI